ncbi:MAG TPA: hypothetical protein VGR87_11125 [Candidatus Limnocylindria bacterium]|jgi:hypothetical protein|nr:hypothetical protein [Candidatus Limnocylindria bacterium]
MKLLLPALLALIVLTGASGPGPMKDSFTSLFTWRDEMAKMRGEMADLRSGRGSAAPAWVAKYAGALCAADATYVVQHTEQSLGLTEADITAQFDRMHASGMDCSGVRYLGSVGDRQFVFVLHHGAKDTWYILTLSDDGTAIAKVE